jgi:hypothetical protein
MNHYTVRAIKGKRCVRRVDSWTIVNARNIYERLLSEFPGALVQIYGPDNKIVPPAEQGISRGPKIIADGLSNAPGSARGAFWPFPKVAKLKRWGKKEGA